MAGKTMWHRTVSMFAIACLAVFIAGPIAIVAGVVQLNEFPGTFGSSSYAPSEEFRPAEPGKLVSIWATGTVLDKQQVSCTDNGEPESRAAASETTTLEGKTFTLVLDGEYSVLNRLSCEGGGIEELRQSTRSKPATAWAFVIGGAVATVVAPIVGLALRRAGFREPLAARTP